MLCLGIRIISHNLYFEVPRVFRSEEIKTSSSLRIKIDEHIFRLEIFVNSLGASFST